MKNQIIVLICLTIASHTFAQSGLNTIDSVVQFRPPSKDLFLLLNRVQLIAQRNLNSKIEYKLVPIYHMVFINVDSAQQIENDTLLLHHLGFEYRNYHKKRFFKTHTYIELRAKVMVFDSTTLVGIYDDGLFYSQHQQCNLFFDKFQLAETDFIFHLPMTMLDDMITFYVTSEQVYVIDKRKNKEGILLLWKEFLAHSSDILMLN